MNRHSETEWMGKYRGLVEKIIRLCNESSTKFCRPADFHTAVELSAHEIQIIEYVLESEGEKMSDIARRLGVTRGAFSNNVTRLIKMGCLKKECRDGNRKNKYVTVTDFGKEVYSAYSRYVYEHTFKDMFSMADTIPEEHVETFCRMLDHFADTLV